MEQPRFDVGQNEAFIETTLTFLWMCEFLHTCPYTSGVRVVMTYGKQKKPVTTRMSLATEEAKTCNVLENHLHTHTYYSYTSMID